MIFCTYDLNHTITSASTIQKIYIFYGTFPERSFNKGISFYILNFLKIIYNIGVTNDSKEKEKRLEFYEEVY